MRAVLYLERLWTTDDALKERSGIGLSLERKAQSAFLSSLLVPTAWIGIAVDFQRAARFFQTLRRTSSTSTLLRGGK
jgi:hypothetical protein